MDLGFEAAVHAGDMIFQPGMFCEEGFVSKDPVHDTPLAGSDRSGTTAPHHSSPPTFTYRVRSTVPYRRVRVLGRDYP